MLVFLKAPFLVLHFSYYTFMTFLMMLTVILLSILMMLISTLKCKQASELASELELDLRDTVACGRKWLVGFNTGKIQLFLFDQSNNSSAITAVPLLLGC